MLRACRYGNTAVDALFYDVQTLWLRLWTHGVTLSTQMTPLNGPAAQGGLQAVTDAAAQLINLSAKTSPEGSILVVDARRPPFIVQYDDVDKFMTDERVKDERNHIDTITVTGVGSSALGSAAFAWNVSEALRRPVAAIVPGYGVADVVQQALGGWFFGMHGFLRRIAQQQLQAAAPKLAAVGHKLALNALEADASAEGRNASAQEPGAFPMGSPGSAILHQILVAAPQIKRLYGHSKGALCLQDAIRGLEARRYDSLHVTTLGCVVPEEEDADYNQILGRYDSLGQLNCWSNWPEQWIDTWHSTNTWLPLTMHVDELATRDVRDEDPVKVDPEQLRVALADALKALMPELRGAIQPVH
ncbi:MAG TPA: hypothetical protein VKG38_17300 [Solirubrobacteraceae bacterium]|nr:hypothetical protein [Solirubrobacteraceae bacterium]